MDDLMLPLPGLSPVCGKSIVARFDGGQMSSDAGVLVLRAVEQRLGVAERLAGCIEDPRTQAGGARPCRHDPVQDAHDRFGI
jgi:hypothetical protein